MAADREAETPGFTLPLTREQFADAIAKGHGRAALHLEAHGDAGMEDILLAAVTQCPVWDIHGDGFSLWIHSFLPTGDSIYKQALLAALARPPESERDLEHLMLLAGCFSLDEGDEEATAALRSAFARLDYPDTLPGARILIKVDGLRGCEIVAKTINALQRDNPEVEVTRGEFDDACMEELRKHATGSLEIADLLDALAKWERISDARSSSREKPSHRPTLAEALRAVEAGSPGLVRRYSKTATKKELKQVLSIIAKEGRPRQLELLLKCFDDREPPQLDDCLFECAMHEIERVRSAAFRALSHFQDSRVRKYALAELERPDWAPEALELLIRNWKDGDERPITEALKRLSSHQPKRVFGTANSRAFWPDDSEGNVAQLHFAGSSLYELIRALPLSPHLVALAIWSYEHGPCSFCREYIFELLIKRHAAPEWMIEEASRDACDETQELAKALLKNG